MGGCRAFRAVESAGAPTCTGSRPECQRTVAAYRPRAVQSCWFAVSRSRVVRGCQRPSPACRPQSARAFIRTCARRRARRVRAQCLPCPSYSGYICARQKRTRAQSARHELFWGQAPGSGRAACGLSGCHAGAGGVARSVRAVGVRFGDGGRGWAWFAAADADATEQL